MRRRHYRPRPRNSRGRLRTLNLTVAVILAAAVGFTAASAYTASNTVPSTNIGVYTHTIGAAELKPAACTGTVTAIIAVPAGGSAQTYNTPGNLILGTSGNDNVTATSGYNCFIGGGPTNNNTDTFTGSTPPSDECIIAASDTGTIKHCTIVQRSP